MVELQTEEGPNNHVRKQVKELFFFAKVNNHGVQNVSLDEMYKDLHWTCQISGLLKDLSLLVAL